MKLFQTKAYKVLMNYVYGWGASAVIIGALFKIMHFPGAGIILTIGMLVEAFIFFLSAFEPALEHYDWSRVFPALSSVSSRNNRQCVGLSLSVSRYISAMLHQIAYDTLSLYSHCNSLH